MRTLYVDFDNTIVNTIKTVVDLYTEKFKKEKGFKYVDWIDVNTYDFDELNLLTKRDLNNFFNSEEFFDRCEFHHFAKEVLKDLSYIYDIKICSLGTKSNLDGKKKFIKKHLPFVKEFIGIDSIKNTDKSSICMKKAYFIDDRADMLESSGAKVKICFGDEYS